MGLVTRTLMVIERSLRPVHNHHSTRLSLTPELHCHLLLSNQLSQRICLHPNNLPDYPPRRPLLLQDFPLRKQSQVKMANKGLN